MPRVAEAAKPRWRLLHGGGPDDVVVTPGNLTAGAAVSFDTSGAHWGPAFGAELFSGSWRRLSWTAAELRIALYRPCRRCGANAEGFAGARLGLVLASDRRRKHMLTASAGAGWGVLGSSWGGRDPSAHGMVLSPRVRYTAMGLVGVEVQALVPAYDPGGPYPATVMFNLVGVPLLLLAGLR